MIEGAWAEGKPREIRIPPLGRGWHGWFVQQLESPWFHHASKRRRYLAGVSGGADSVALLHLLHRHGFRDVVVCHLNHGLRGRAGAGDARFVVALAGSLGFRCEVGQVDVAAMMALRGLSMETAAREARHGFFARCARKHRCRRLLLAHHGDDQAETILWNLLRGSRGLVGMRESGFLEMDGLRMECVRPLLDLRRAELRAWLSAEGLRWREDASNAEPVAVRNRIRHEVLPLLAEIARRDVSALLVRAGKSANELREIERWAVAEAGVCDPQGRLHVPKLRSLPPELQASCIHAFLTSAGIGGLSWDLVGRCRALIDSANAVAAVNLPGGRVLRRRAGRLVIAP